MAKKGPIVLEKSCMVVRTSVFPFPAEGMWAALGLVASAL